MNLLVTGSNGFIGGYICERLKKEHKVIGIGRKKENRIPDIEYLKEDITSDFFVDNVKSKLNKVDVIIHAAACISKNDFEHDLIYTNCRGTLNIVKLAKELKAHKIIHLSSLPVIGKPLILPIREDHPTSPITLYHTTKLAAEHIINLSSKYGVNPINLRITSPIGIGMNENTILTIFLKNSLNNNPIYVYGKGQRKQNYIDVRDIAEAIALILDYNVEGIFNIGSASSISNLDLAYLCKDITDSKSEIVLNSKEDPEEDFCWDVSCEKAQKAFNFIPQYTLQESIIQISNHLKLTSKKIER